MRRRRSAIVLAAAIALAVAAPASAGGSRFPLGDFAGYVWRSGPVAAVSATLTVPRIGRPSPRRSIAGTWIGAQAPGVDGPFIQIGINQVHVTPSLAVYYAFWSDTTLQFHPRFIFAVHAGDVVAASLRRRPAGWALAIVDATTRVARRFTTADEAAGAFNLAEFLQEDPTSSAHSELPYPRLAGGRFRQLRVNDATPPRGTLLSQWMSNQRDDIAPSRLAGDAFTLHPTKLTAAVARYLRLIAPPNLAGQAYDTDVAGWRRPRRDPRSPRHRRRSRES
ncbi:MAG: G1 family glutamic endopeptidase [Solirubrobacteraceae bacterium]